MEKSNIMDFLVLEKRMYGQLTEVNDLTQQIAEALKRQDQVSVRLLVSMRQEPINQLHQVKENLEARKADLSPEDAARVAALLRGGPAAEPAEQQLADQIATNRRLLTRTIEIDKHLNMRLGGKDSFYAGTTANIKPPAAK